MPTYQYSCTECGHFFEQFQSFSEDSLTVCPECQGRLRKVFNAVGVVFKGSGFYRTDSRSASTSTDSGKPSGKPSSAPSGDASPSSGGSASTTSGSTGGSTGGGSGTTTAGSAA